MEPSSSHPRTPLRPLRADRPDDRTRAVGCGRAGRTERPCQLLSRQASSHRLAAAAVHRPRRQSSSSCRRDEVAPAQTVIQRARPCEHTASDPSCPVLSCLGRPPPLRLSSSPPPPGPRALTVQPARRGRRERASEDVTASSGRTRDERTGATGRPASSERPADRRADSIRDWHSTPGARG
jgi:hypothetical protein